MTSQGQALFIAITWAALLVLYFLIRYFLIKRLFKHASTVILTRPPGPIKPPGTFLSKTGVLFVFVINIITIFLLFTDAWLPSIDLNTSRVTVSLSPWTQPAGAVLFLLITVWAFFTQLFNPNYTPLYKLPPRQFMLANRGPYALIRHPRYTAEALLNIVLFLLTGIWLPLLGLIGWAAVVSQARAEESFLMKVAPREYGSYQKRTGMFFPLLHRKHSEELTHHTGNRNDSSNP